MVDAQTPNLATIKNSASETEARALLYIALCEVCDFFNVGKNMSDTQIALTVDLVLESFWHLKLEEIKFCLRRAMRREKLYDRLDGNIILGWIKDYDDERTEQAMRLADEKEAQRITRLESETEGLTAAEYRAYLQQKADSGDEDAADKLATLELYRSTPPLASRQQQHESKVAFKQWYFNSYLNNRK